MKVSWGGLNRCYEESQWLVIDILFPFAKGVLYRESGVLNSHQLSVDILKIIGEGECRGATMTFIKIFRLWKVTVQILYKQKRTPVKEPSSGRFFMWLLPSTHTAPNLTPPNRTLHDLTSPDTAIESVLGCFGSKPSTVSHYTYLDSNVKKLLTGGVPMVTYPLSFH